MEITRPTWDEWALGIAKAVSARADCTRRLVGSVLLSPDHAILATGYNGYPSGKPGCLSGACPRGQKSYDEVKALSPYVETEFDCGALHSEENVVLRSTKEQRQGATLYVTCKPCPNCFRLLSGSGIVRIVWPEGEK